MTDKYLCQSCGSSYNIDLIIPDEFWAVICVKKYDGKGSGGLMCGSCIMKKLEAIADKADCFYLAEPNKMESNILTEDRYDGAKVTKVDVLNMHVKPRKDEPTFKEFLPSVYNRVLAAMNEWASRCVLEYAKKDPGAQSGGGEKLSKLFRETVMRSQLAFPENEQDIKWFDQGLKDNHLFFIRLFDALDLGDEEKQLEQYNKEAAWKKQ